jgi:hypothetical protein
VITVAARLNGVASDTGDDTAAPPPGRIRDRRAGGQAAVGGLTRRLAQTAVIFVVLAARHGRRHARILPAPEDNEGSRPQALAARL